MEPLAILYNNVTPSLDSHGETVPHKKGVVLSHYGIYSSVSLADFHLRKINPSLLSRHLARLLYIWLQALAPKRGSCALMKCSALPCRRFTSVDAMFQGGNVCQNNTCFLPQPKLIMGSTLDHWGGSRCHCLGPQRPAAHLGSAGLIIKKTLSLLFSFFFTVILSELLALLILIINDLYW